MNTALLLVLRELLFFFFDMNTLMKSIILVHFTSPLIVNVSFLADI